MLMRHSLLQLQRFSRRTRCEGTMSQYTLNQAPIQHVLNEIMNLITGDFQLLPNVFQRDFSAS